MPDTPPKPIVFISYSHKDEPDPHLNPGGSGWLSYVQSHLAPAMAHGRFETWDDRRIEGGGDWRAEIDAALNRCAVCILLVSRHSLSSRFILDEEMKRMLERHHRDGTRIYPIVITACDVEAADWLMRLNLKPRDGTPLALYQEAQRDAVMADLAKEIRGILQHAAETPPPNSGPAPAPAPAPALIDYGRLPDTPYKALVGRDAELARLDAAWTDGQANIVSLVAEGGAGKSALVNEWLVRLQGDGYGGAEAVLGWSFYSQGSKERVTSADSFLDWALGRLGLTVASTSATVKAEAIAGALARRRVLLVLDGVEPLQHGPGPEHGRLKDQGLRTLLRRIAALPSGAGSGLVVLTSRVAVADIDKWRNGSTPVIDLDNLSAEAGAALLHDNGVTGTAAELHKAVGEFGGHALALSLLAGYLRDLHAGDVRCRDRIAGLLADADNPGHGHARRVMHSYEDEWLSGKPLLLAILHIVGLFDRPATKDCLDALRQPPAITGLTDIVIAAGEDAWKRAVARLREARLLAPENRQEPDTLDAHPLVREWFGERLRAGNEAAWRAAHGRLYEHLRDTTQEGDRPSLADLAPLYQAIPHGCRAERHREALDDIYKQRICRREVDGTIGFYALKKLGAFGSDLAALCWLFDKPFDQPAVNLSELDRMWIIGIAAYGLVAQGRSMEALTAQRACLDLYFSQRDWRNAAASASNLADAELLVGNITAAVAAADRAVDLAKRSRDEFLVFSSQTARANARHATGMREMAEYFFIEAECRQRAFQPNYPLLYSVRGYRYCDLILARGDWTSAFHRASKTIKWVQQNEFLLSTALDTVTLGRAQLGLALEAAARADPIARRTAMIAGEHLNEAMERLRHSGQADYVPHGLLARAVFRRSIGDWNGSKHNLDDAFEIAEPGPMRLHLCDMALERARLALARIEGFAPLAPFVDGAPPPPAPAAAAECERLTAEARAHLAEAADLIERCGYHRRDEELAELQDVLADRRRFADLPPRV